MYEGFGQCHTAAPAARQLIHSLVSGQTKFGHGRLDTLFDMPASVRVYQLVKILEFTQALLVELFL